MSEARVVGSVTAVRCWIHSLELFGTNDLLRTYMAPVLHDHTYEAAAIALCAKRLSMPIPGHDDPKKTIRLARRSIARTPAARALICVSRSNDRRGLS